MFIPYNSKLDGTLYRFINQIREGIMENNHFDKYGSQTGYSRDGQHFDKYGNQTGYSRDQ